MSNRVLAPEVGEIYHLRFTRGDGIIPKNPEDTYRDKFFVVVGLNNEGDVLGYLFINSTINKGLSQEVKDFHYKISCSDYSFLDHDSQIDCSDLKQMTIIRFAQTINRGKCGMLNKKDLEIVLDLVVISPTSVTKILRKFNLI